VDLPLRNWFRPRTLPGVEAQRLDRAVRVLALVRAQERGLHAELLGKSCPDYGLDLLLISTLVIGTVEVVRLLHNDRNRKVFAFEPSQQLSSAGFANWLPVPVGVGHILATVPRGGDAHHQVRVGLGWRAAGRTREDQ
jgi:hypothetical protein